MTALVVGAAMTSTARATCEDPKELSGFRGVARIEAVVHDPDGLWVILVDIPYDGTVLLARCPTQREVDVLVMAIA